MIEYEKHFLLEIREQKTFFFKMKFEELKCRKLTFLALMLVYNFLIFVTTSFLCKLYSRLEST